VDLDYFRECRQHFTFKEWLDLMVSSIGFSPRSQTLHQNMILITRIIPLAEPRVNIVELAPKGTGKSFVYDNLSRYARVVAGGKITPAVLFHNLVTHTPGLITRYDVIVLDEVQSIRGDSAGELIAGLKVYLESGRYSRGNTMGTSEAGFVMLGNLTLDADYQPMYNEDGLFREIPNFLQETAFIDRIHGLMAGWEMGRVTKDTPSRSMGFKGDFFSEILHVLRSDAHYGEYVSHQMRLINCDDLRDRKAITRLATGFLKLLFPDMKPTEEQFKEFCVKPAVELRQRIRDELYKLDPEYAEVEIWYE
jgi:ATP-dependent Lon protease